MPSIKEIIEEQKKELAKHIILSRLAPEEEKKDEETK